MSSKSTDIIKLDGTIIKADGSTKKSSFFDFLNIDLDDYSDVAYTREEAMSIRTHLMHLSTGASAAIPLICGGPNICPFSGRCPFVILTVQKQKLDPNAKSLIPLGKRCHPPGEKILTAYHGYIPIEELNPEVHQLVTWEKRRNCIRFDRLKNNGFKVGKSLYSGDFITITTESEKSYTCTSDHICIAQFNEKAIDKFAVYLMRQGDFWRVGKSKLISHYNSTFHKTIFSIVNRGKKEKADCLWILGIYETNTEALLAEDYFSASWQTSKACFLATNNTKKIKWNGLYKWVTQEQLDRHHESLKKDESFYRDKLKGIGLSIDFPFWDNNIQKKIGTLEIGKIYVNYPMFIRACNIIPGIMIVPVIPTEDRDSVSQIGNGRIKKSDKFYMAGREQIVSLKRYSVDNLVVYSLESYPHPTYFVDDIATHNCLVETNLLNEWTRLYIQEFEIDEKNFTEFQMARELAEIELLLWRINNNLAKPENAELIEENATGMDKQGNVFTRKEMSSLMNVKTQLWNRKSKLHKLMVGDRQEKYKRDAALKTRPDDDPSISSAKLHGEIKRLLKEAKNLDLKVKATEGKVLEVSDGNTKVLSPEDLINKE
jgi:hypothetical protein